MSRRSAILGRFARETKATAAAEFALLVPMLVILLFGGAEAGHFVWTQHKLVEAVRDGARYASRLSVESVCDEAFDDTDIILLTRTGQLASTAAKPVVPGWNNAAQVDVKIDCNAFVNTGIYADLGDLDENGTLDAGPVVTVQAVNVPYPSLFSGLAGLGTGIKLSAKSSAAVIGI